MFLLSKTSILRKARFSVWRRFDHIFGHSRVAWVAPELDFWSSWALFEAFRALLGRCWTSPGRHFDTPGTFFNSIWVLWHAQKVAGSMQKTILGYFGTVPYPPWGLHGGTLHQNHGLCVFVLLIDCRAKDFLQDGVSDGFACVNHVSVFWQAWHIHTRFLGTLYSSRWGRGLLHFGQGGYLHGMHRYEPW